MPLRPTVPDSGPKATVSESRSDMTKKPRSSISHRRR